MPDSPDSPPQVLGFFNKGYWLKNIFWLIAHIFFLYIDQFTRLMQLMQLMQSMQFMHLMQFMQGGRRTHTFICRRGSQNSTICRCGVAERIKKFQKKISAYILFRPPIQCVGFTPLRTHIHFKWSLRVRTRGSTATANMSGGIKLCNWSSQVTKSPRLGSSHSLH